MRQMQIDRFGGPEELHVAEAPAPQAGPGQVVIRVEAAGVNPLDHKIRDGSSGLAARIAPEDFPLVLGRECCGVVESAGEGADLEPGQRVFGMVALSDPVGRCYAEQVAVDASAFAQAPDGVPSTVLGGAALASYTAWAAVHDLARVQPGETVLVHGAGGGVGQLMVQLAVRAGARVYGTASAEKAERVRSLGATPVDYVSEDFGSVVPPPDVVLDGVYFDTFEPSLDHLAPGGRVVVLPTLADLTPAQERGIEAHIPSISPDRAVLAQVGELLASGDLSIEVGQTFPLEGAADAQRLLAEGHARGKVVLEVG